MYNLQSDIDELVLNKISNIIFRNIMIFDVGDAPAFDLMLFGVVETRWRLVSRIKL